MNNQLNASSYYRANPFYQQGYMPDFALKNRKVPSNLVEIPQGEQHFDPTNKKHFQRLGYYSTIAEQNIIHNKQQIFSPSRDKEYFRSLNVNDIEGATTNTLISKGVKNKLKAQEQLMRKKNEEQYLAKKSQMMTYLKQQDQRKQKQALQKIKKNNQPNYHQLTKKLRTQQAQNIKSVLNTQQAYPKPNSPIYQRASQQQNQQFPKRQQQYMQFQGRQIKNDKNGYDYYKNQLKNTEQEIQQLQLQLSKIKQNRVYVNNQVNSNKMQDYNQYNYERQQQYVEKQNNYFPRQRQGQDTILKNQNYNDSYKNSQPYQAQRNPQIYPQYQPKTNQYNQLYENQRKLSANNEPLTGKQQANYYDHYSPKINGHADYQKSMSIKDLQPKEQRQIHRRINPTYLSYGSAIGLAGKNIVGY